MPLTLQEHLHDMETASFDTNKTANGHCTIKQSQRNALRKQLSEELYNLFQEQDIRSFQTVDGVIIDVENDSVGGDICIEVKLSIKALDYDIDMAVGKYDEKEAARAAKKSAADSKANK